MASKIENLIEAERWPGARRAIRAELRSSSEESLAPNMEHTYLLLGVISLHFAPPSVVENNR